jgi:hypothetical protein
MRAGLLVVAVVAVMVGGACSSGGGRSLGAFCSRVKEMQGQNGAFDITNPTNTKAAVDHSISQMQTISGVAPEEIRPEVETVVNSLEAIRSGDTDAMRRNQEGFAQASVNLSAYIGSRCGINRATTGTTK